MKAIPSLVTFAALTIAETIFTPGAHAKTAQIVVPKIAISTAFNTALSAMEVHVNDYGAKHGASWYKNTSYVLLPNGTRKSIPVSEYEIAVTGKRHLKYYVSDFNSSNMTAKVDGSNIKLVVAFESQGEEVKGKCVHRKHKKWKECSLKMERDIHLNNARLAVALKPVAYHGGISFASNPKVRFSTDVHIASRLCNAFKGICHWIERKIKNELTDGVQNSVKAGLNGSRQAVADAVMRAPAVRKLINAHWKVTDIRSSGSNFVVTVRR